MATGSSTSHRLHASTLRVLHDLAEPVALGRQLDDVGARPQWSDLGWGPLAWLAAIGSQVAIAAVVPIDWKPVRVYFMISLILSFCGGGTRAAALAYGVMLELRDTRMIIDGIERSLLGEVDVISSVSGGSFTAAYYGLFGDQLFEFVQGQFGIVAAGAELEHRAGGGGQQE